MWLLPSFRSGPLEGILGVVFVDQSQCDKQSHVVAMLISLNKRFMVLIGLGGVFGWSPMRYVSLCQFLRPHWGSIYNAVWRWGLRDSCPDPLQYLWRLGEPGVSAGWHWCFHGLGWPRKTIFDPHSVWKVAQRIPSSGVCPLENSFISTVWTCHYPHTCPFRIWL